MKKVMVKVQKNSIIFSEWVRKTDDKELNNTNVINIDSIKLSEDYIHENLDLVSQFIKLLCLKNEITNAVINSMSIADLAIKILNNVDNITSLNFTEDKEVNYTITSKLLYNKTLKKIECYCMPDILFRQFPANRVETREEILFLSNFMENNNINTMSKLSNKDKIEIDAKLSEEDLDELKFFFDENQNLSKMIINNYDRKGLIAILDLLNRQPHKKILIIINENKELTKHILGDVDLFKKLCEIYCVTIKIKYSKEYTNKYRPIEYSIKSLRFILMCIVILALVFIVWHYYEHKNDVQDVNDQLDEITEMIDDIENTEEYYNPDELEDDYEEIIDKDGNKKLVKRKKGTYVSPYYKKYAQAYESLLSINKDTIGWLKVNNTRINYPVVQANDNKYYLNHNFDKKRNNLGWIFADYRNTFSILSDNTIIYGHNAITLGLMFGSLDRVLNSSWYNNENNQTIMFSVKGEIIYWRIFSIYTTKTTEEYLKTDFTNRKEYQTFLNKIKSRSIKNFNVNVTSNDRILTLSTCHNDNNHRLVVHAVKVK